MSDLSRDLASLRIDRGAAGAQRGEGRASARRGIPGWLVTLVIIAALVAGGVAVAPQISSRVFKPEVQVTEIALVSPSQGVIDLSSTGYVLPQSVAKIGSKMIGRILEVNVKEGSKVKAGDVLFQLDSTDQKTALATAKAKVFAAGARVNAARARAAAAKSNADEVRAQLARQKKLVEGGAAPANTVEDFELKLKGLEAQVAVAEADVASAQSDVSGSQVDIGTFEANLHSMTILAPISGTVTTKPVAVGDVVNFERPLCEIADFNSLVVETDVPEARLSLVKPGGPCEVVLDAFPDKRLRGEVVEIVPKLNRAKATGTVKVKIVDSQEGILPEMAARVSFLQKALEKEKLAEAPKKVVPASALVDRGGMKHVFVLDNGKVKLVPVTLGAPIGSGFELKDGPGPGTRLVKNPTTTLSDGQAVKEGTL